MHTFTDENFKANVLDNDQLTMVDFWAAWCGPCRVIAPVIENLAKQYAGRVTIGKLDIEAAPKTTENHKIQSIPTLILFKNGKEVDRIIGLRSEADLAAVIDKHLAA